METNRDTPASPEVFATLSSDELAVVCTVAGVPLLPGLRDSTYVTLTGDERRQAFESAFRSLVAHSVVQGDEGRATLTENLRPVVAVAGEPKVRAAVRRTLPDSQVWSHFSMRHDLAVEHRWNLIDVHELAPFPASEFTARVAESVGLGAQPAQDVSGFEITVADLTDSLIHLNSDRSHARAVLERSAPAESVEALIVALDSLVGWGELMLGYRISPTELGWCEYSWLDAGAVGMWSVPFPGFSPWESDEMRALAPEAHTTKILVEPVSAMHLTRWLSDQIGPLEESSALTTTGDPA
jgi:hypothetical protein